MVTYTYIHAHAHRHHLCTYIHTHKQTPKHMQTTATLSPDAHRHTRTPEHAHPQEQFTVIDHVMRTFIGHVMFPHACIAHSKWSRDAYKHMRTHSHSSVT